MVETFMLLECLAAVADPRRAQGRRYPLPYILLFSILAMLCGATSYRKIQRFINAHRERLNESFGLRWKRAPAHTAIRYILQGLEGAELERAFRTHSRRLLESHTPPAESARPLAIALDGKALRGSFDRFQDQKAAQVLSAFCQEEQIILGHLPVATKTNEIPVAQQLIEELGLGGCLYTLDALHCQKKPLKSSPARATR
jgi:DDE_Tnp_1-associated